ncbi:alcohol dehydrogenase transcription factor myb/SANT-like domain-containing protein [Phthorimaea operculella]|nr:alcohol dehydrogenase transcription factor myb/SANT-like domain-containing protein [Phthorimaea operculella]
MEWTKEATKVLIQLYEENELLYNSLNSNYRNRTKRLECLMKIAEHLTSVTGQMCLVMDVRKKINGLRSQYTQEKLKIAKSICQGGVVYEPTAYWFPLLKFLDLPNEYDETLSYPDESDGLEKSQSEETDKKTRKGTKRKQSEESKDKTQNNTEPPANWSNGTDGNYQLLELNPFVEKKRKVVLNGTYVPENEDETPQNEVPHESQARNEELRRKTHTSNSRMNSFAETIDLVDEHEIIQTQNNRILREVKGLENVTLNLQRVMEQFKGKRACSNTAINSFTDFLAIELQEILDTDKRTYMIIKTEIMRILCGAWNKLTDLQYNNTEVQIRPNYVRDPQSNVAPNPKSTVKVNLKKKTSNGCPVLRNVQNAELQDVPEVDFERFLIRHNLCSCAKCAKQRHNSQEAQMAQGTNNRDCNPSTTQKDNNSGAPKN